MKKNLEEIKKEFHRLFNGKKEEVKCIDVENTVREYLQSLPNSGELISCNELISIRIKATDKDYDKNPHYMEDDLHDTFCMYARRNRRFINYYTLYDCAPVNIFEGTDEPYFVFTTYKVEKLSGKTCAAINIGDEFTWGLKLTIVNTEGDVKFKDLIK